MGNSRLRPETRTAEPGSYSPEGGTAYYMIHGAVESQPGLIHGKLNGPAGAHCAIGSYFAVTHAALNWKLIDEVAAVNDSVPHYTPKKRKAFVLRWLKWRMTQLGMPGCRTTTRPAR